MSTKDIVIFVSGTGSNMESIIRHFEGNNEVNIRAVFSNKPNCLAIEKAKGFGVDTLVFSKADLEAGVVTSELVKLKPTLIVLAGFLLKIPNDFVAAFEDKIINVHPALLPKFGGKGMYGKYVHEAVIKTKETQSGITIHYVNEDYDEGNIIAQHSCAVDENETVESLQKKIHGLEQQFFAKEIESLLNNLS